jgi:ubiquinone/menaquinone biosynthesis C-methylase UbiE
MNDVTHNIDHDVAAGFGREWSTFRQTDQDLSTADRKAVFESYFRIFPWDTLGCDAVGMDVGCGSGRWSAMVAPRVGHLHLLDASPDALGVARQNLAGADNVSFHLASVGDISLPDNSLDFAFSLGVLHHVPDTAAAISSIAAKLKRGAPFLVYLYYAFDNRPRWYRAIWRVSDILRLGISRLPAPARLAISQTIALLVYWPLARLAAIVERLGFSPSLIPLEAYRRRTFYVMRTDAYDRFCTRLEQRFTRNEIENMMRGAGFSGVRFSEQVPYWCAVGRKA